MQPTRSHTATTETTEITETTETIVHTATLCLAFSILVAAASGQQIDDQKVRQGLSSITSADTMKKLKKLAADEFEGRNAGYPGCWEAAEWIASRFRELGLEAVGEQDSYFQTFTFNARGRDAAARGASGRQKRKGKKRRKSRRDRMKPPHHETPTTRNVVALLAGSDPQLKDEVVVLGGHYDHVGREGQWNRGSRRGNAKSKDYIWNGADDNASGTTVVIEVAEAFVASGIRPKRSILFILFSAEEHGLFGSKWYCAHPLRPLEKTVAMLNFDMVSYKKKKSIEIVGVNHASGQVLRSTFLKALKQVRGLKAELKPWARSGGSDHAPFIQARVPAVFFFNGLHNDYHTIEDEAKLVSGKRMADVAKVGFLSAIELAELPEKPAFVAATGAVGGATILGLSVAGNLSEEEARELELKDSQGGIKVGNVYAMTPAADLGLASGDVIIAVGKTTIVRGKEDERLNSAVRKLKPGQSFSLKVMRDGKKQTLRGKMPK
ncbi:MAG: M20/M25/M40 family metallo-hydrolase [Planctomycetota bacterium]